MGNYGRAYEYYLRALEQDSRCTEGWLGRAITAGHWFAQNRPPHSPATPEQADLVLAEFSRVAEESLFSFEQACGLLQNGHGDCESAILEAQAVVVSIGVRAGLNTVDRQDKLGRLIRCLIFAWDKFPTVRLGQALLENCSDFLSCCDQTTVIAEPLREWVGETASRVDHWLEDRSGPLGR